MWHMGTSYSVKDSPAERMPEECMDHDLVEAQICEEIGRHGIREWLMIISMKIMRLA